MKAAIKTTIDPHQHIIARFPFTGAVRPLTSNERNLNRIATNTMLSCLKEIPNEIIPLSVNALHRLRGLEDKACEFEKSEIPKKFPRDPAYNFQMAWDPFLAARLTFLINDHFEKRPINILQIACNYAPLLWFISKETGAKVFGLDASQEALDFANTLNKPYFVDLRKGTAHNIPFDAEMFDVVISRHFLCSNYRPAYFGELSEKEQIIVAEELLKDPNILLPHYLKLLWQIDRVLAPGGYFISAHEDMLTPKTASLYFKKLIKMGGLGLIMIAQK